MPYKDPAAKKANDAAYYARKKDDQRERRAAYSVANRDRERELHRRYYQRHRDALRARNRADYLRRIDFYKDYQRRYRLEHLEKLKAQGRAWERANAEKVRAAHRAWKRRHPEKGAADAALRRARQATAPRVERVDRLTVFARDGGRCHLCGVLVDPAGWHLDHIVPLARGGDHTYDNVAVSHPFCNRRKGART